MRNYQPRLKKGQHGFGSVMVVVIVVILAALAAAIVRLGATQQLTSSQDVLSSRAWAAARAGNEWGLYKAISAASVAAPDPRIACGNPGLSSSLNLSATTGFWVTVTCTSTTFYEGESTSPTTGTLGPQQVVVTVIQATACNSATSCPDPAMATTPGYVERVRQVTTARLIQLP